MTKIQKEIIDKMKTGLLLVHENSLGIWYLFNSKTDFAEQRFDKRSEKTFTKLIKENIIERLYYPDKYRKYYLYRKDK